MAAALSSSSFSPFPVHRDLLVAALVVVALAAPPARAEPTRCVIDSASGFPVSQTIPSLCVVQGGVQTILVQTTDDGLLIAAADTGRDDLGPPNADGTAPLNIYDRESAIVFCPPGLLDAATGVPTRECLLDLGSVSAGPGALVGSGRLFAAAVVDASGAARCPSSVTVMALATTPGGDTLDLTSSFNLAPIDPRAAAGDRAAPSCGVSRQSVRLAYRSTAEDDVALLPAGLSGAGSQISDDTTSSISSQLHWLGQLSDDEWRLVAELIRLDDGEWDVLHRLMSLDTTQLNRLQTTLQTDGAALLADDGTVGPAPEPGASAAGTVVTTEGVDNIFDVILSRVNSVLSTVGSISGRIPNRSDIRGLLMDGSFVSRIATVIQRVREIIGGVLDVAATMREGYDTWYGSGCDSSSQCAAFKDDLAQLFDDIGDTSEFLQSLSCLENPGLQIRRPDMSLIRTLVIDNAPPVVLYALAKVLERIDPSAGGGGWKRLFRDVLDEVSPDFRANLLELCGRQMDAVEMGGSSGLACRILRPEEVGLNLTTLRVIAYRKRIVAQFIDSFLKDDVVAQADAVAGGGGGAGTNVKNPPKVVSEQAKDIADDLPEKITNVMDLRSQCLDADAEIEGQLLDCQPPISVLLQTITSELPPRPTFQDATAVVNLRLTQVRECQSAGVCTGLRADDAQSYLSSARANSGTPQGYTYLCCAYQALNGGTQIQCPRP